MFKERIYKMLLKVSSSAYNIKVLNVSENTIILLCESIILIIFLIYSKNMEYGIP